MAEACEVSRILVIESDADARNSLSQFLSAHGYSVDEADDGEEGLYRAHEAAIPYDLMLLADHLPDATGLEMLPALQVLSPESLVVVMSHSSAHERFSDAMAAGAYEFLQKPPSLEEVLDVVARAIKERRNGFPAEKGPLGGARGSVERDVPCEDLSGRRHQVSEPQSAGLGPAAAPRQSGG